MTTQEQMFVRLSAIDQLLADTNPTIVPSSNPKQLRENLYRATRRRGWRWKFKITKYGVRIERSG